MMHGQKSIKPDVSQYLFLSHHFELVIDEMSRYKV
jgi:hypothetical protein